MNTFEIVVKELQCLVQGQCIGRSCWIPGQ